MQFPTPGIYHVYNRGNHQEPIFFNRADYLAFLDGFRKHLLPKCEVYGWCLMPTHFHFLIEVGESGLTQVKWGGNMMPAISNGFQLLQSAFAKRHNALTGRKGNLFQQKTKNKLVEHAMYLSTCFWYVHFNPVAGGLVERMDDWEFSSYRDFCGLRNGTLVNCQKAMARIGFSAIDFTLENMKVQVVELPWVQ